MEPRAEGQIRRSLAEREQLAKEWLVRVIERTPLPDVGGLPLGWIVAEAPSLIGEILTVIAEPGSAADRELSAEEVELVGKLAQLRNGTDAAEQIPRDLAALQAVLIEKLRPNVGERRSAEFANSLSRLAEVFGSIQGALTKSIVERHGGGGTPDPLTGMLGKAKLDEWLRILLAEHRRYGHPFALALVDVDGLDRINEAGGRVAGDRVLAAVAAVIRRQVREADQAFRLDGDEFAVVAPHSEGGGLVRMAGRISELIAAAQAADGPRIAITAGIAACPEDGMNAETLLRSLDEASYAAKAENVPVARRNGAPIDLQDQ